MPFELSDSPSSSAGYVCTKVEGSKGDDLEANGDFDVTFDPSNGGSIDPKLTLSSPATPNSRSNGACVGGSVLHQTVSPGSFAFDAYGAEVDGRTPSPLHFQSVEIDPTPVFHPSPLRNSYRRSISEPPGAPPTQQHSSLGITFHRDKHYLGKPIQQHHTSLKSLPKNKELRHHPYPCKKNSVPEQPQQPQCHHIRPGNRRIQPQPVHAGPTSVPVQMSSQYFPHLHPIMQEPHYLHSRMCTPVSDAVGISHSAIDPNLTKMPNVQQISSDTKSVVAIPLTVDELRTMIFEVVQQAITSVSESRREAVDGSKSGKQDVATNVVEEVVVETATTSQ